MSELLEWKDLSKNYSEQSRALYSQSFSIDSNDKLAIVGATGSGKSTLLRMLAGLEQPTNGEIRFNGEKVAGPNDKLIPGHTQIAYLSQHFELPKFIRVEEYLSDPYLIAEEDANAIRVACRVDHLLNNDTRQLSGGEKQRVALAKLLMRTPSILLLDEPFSNLDFKHKNIIKEVLDSVGKELKTSIILVSHDPVDVLPWASQIMVLQYGKVEQITSPSDIYNKPVNEYVAGLFGPYNLLSLRSLGLTAKSIIRPEKLKVSKRAISDISGIIIKKHYYGSYESLFVQYKKDIIEVRSGIGSFKVGDRVFIKLIP